MAGWKLRKDKTQSETDDTAALEAISPATETAPSPAGAATYVLPTAEDDAEPASRWEMPEEDWQAPAEAILLSPVEDEPETEAEVAYPQPKFFDLSGEPLSGPDLTVPDDTVETDEALHFAEDDEVKAEEDPLVLVDYSAPAPVAAPPPISMEPMPVVSSPAPSEPAPVPTPAEMDGITSTLRMDRSELAAALPSPPVPGAVPSVAPFVLDLPPAAPTSEEAHRLVMRVGRLSAAFELAKAVSTIGRPDSALHYYLVQCY